MPALQEAPPANCPKCSGAIVLVKENSPGSANRNARIPGGLRPLRYGNNVDGFAIKIPAYIPNRDLKYGVDRVWRVVCHVWAEHNII